MVFITMKQTTIWEGKEHVGPAGIESKKQIQELRLGYGCLCCEPSCGTSTGRLEGRPWFGNEFHHFLNSISRVYHHPTGVLPLFLENGGNDFQGNILSSEAPLRYFKDLKKRRFFFAKNCFQWDVRELFGTSANWPNHFQAEAGGNAQHFFWNSETSAATLQDMLGVLIFCIPNKNIGDIFDYLCVWEISFPRVVPNTL